MYRKIFGSFWLCLFCIFNGPFPVNCINHSRQRSHIWADQALEFVRNKLDCAQYSDTDSYSDSFTQCSAAKTTPRFTFRVHVAIGSSPDLQATLPDQRLGGSHDAFLVLDPFPDLAFGHFVVVFAVDSVKNKAKCRKENQILLESHNDCLELITKRCPTNSSSPIIPEQPKKCAINFLPLIFELKNSIPVNIHDTRYVQKLSCLPVPGFAQCSIQPSGNRLVEDACNETSSQSECAESLEARLAESVRCRYLETCDHAAIINGFWSYTQDTYQAEKTLKRLREELTVTHKFAESNVKTFFANGKIHTANFSMRNFYPVSFKQLVRSHLREVCQQLFCIDTFAVFLMGSGLPDGSLLLWDKDYDGYANNKEIYSPSEIVEDLSNCEAARLYVIADYSYSGRLAAHFQNSSAGTKNTILLTTGNGPSTENRLSGLWAEHSNRNICFPDANLSPFYTEPNPFTNSKTITFDSSKGEIRTTLTGNPCNSQQMDQNDQTLDETPGCRDVPLVVFWRGAKNVKHQNRQKSFLLARSNETMLKKRKSFI